MTNVDYYRALRRTEPWPMPARLALSIQRAAHAAEAEGLAPLLFGGEVTWRHAGVDFTVELDQDEWGDRWDGDCYGEVIDRYRHPDYIGGESGQDRADGETILALDPATAYRVDKAAESVSYLADQWWRDGASRAVRRDLARTSLVATGREMARDESYVYVITVIDPATGASESLHGVDLDWDTTADRALALSYLRDLARDLAGELLAARHDRADRLRARFPHLPILRAVA